MRHDMSSGHDVLSRPSRALLRSLLVLSLAVWMGTFAWATSLPDIKSAVPLKLVNESEEGFRYEQAGTGVAFDSIIEDNSSNEFCALFEIDDGVYYELWQDGAQISYESGNAIVTEGNYQLLVAPSKNQRETKFSIFTFHIGQWTAAAGDGTVTIAYLRTYEKFGFSLDGEPSFMLNVPNGGLSTEVVTLTPVSTDVYIREWYFNGKKQDDLSVREFSTPGSYLLRLRMSLVYDYWVSFRILLSSDCAITFVPVQEGISCRSASDAQLIGSTLYLPRDGTYRFQFSCAAAESAKNWETTMKRDTTLPGVCFSESVSSGKVGKKMHVTAISPDARLLVYLDDLPQASFDGSFDEDGRYRVIVYDHAGNAQFLSFYLYQLDRFFLMGAGLVGMLIILLLIPKVKQSDLFSRM